MTAETLGKAGEADEAGGTGAPDADAGRRRRSPWLGFAMRRLAGLGAVLATLVTVTFLIVQLIPGDPARVLAGPDAGPEQIAEARERLGLGEPLVQRFAAYVGGLFRGDLGTSFTTGGSR
ncbi:hypothetical protein [Actinomadura sp. 21ATH]|uniref:hypothetical protein n=1 Tax=Actinomadura sp. 21ATH TaxID=1735444 RepID=UPI0035C04463